MQLTNEIFENLELQTQLSDTSAQIINREKLPSYFSVSELAAGSVLAFGEALRALLSSQDFATAPTLEVDQRLASLWFGTSLQLVDGKQPNPWNSIAGDYRCANGWIRLHTNASHHKTAALKVLGVAEDRTLVGKAVANWNGQELESAIVDVGGCAAKMQSLEDWQEHPQGKAVATEPLIRWQISQYESSANFTVRDQKAPLKGLRVLDLTRVIAGPVATRALAGFGATVLRLDPSSWDEPGLYEDLTIGKNCAHLDLKTMSGREQFRTLLKDAHVLVHGLRADALARLGFSVEQIREINPNLVDVAHNAYGWSGPWKNRRGFDSLVQMSAGIADFGMKASQTEKPTPMPVQALDHATGYLVAAAVLVGLKRAKLEKRAISARTSLARVAHMLAQSASSKLQGGPFELSQNDFTRFIEQTHCGPAKRLKSALAIKGIEQNWSMAAGPLRAASANWPTI